jgi:hypothetical protein
MPDTNTHNIRKYVASKANPSFASKLLCPLPLPKAQRGHICKLVAPNTLANYYYCIRESLPPPVPTRKSEQFSATVSLRYYAKVMGSEVGEVYDINHLSEIIESIDYSPDILETTSSTFIPTILDSLDKDLAPLIFFDVDLKTGKAGCFGGKNEHCAVIAGYFTDTQGQLKFLTLHWGRYYIYNAKDLERSSAQLMEIRKPETFAKKGKTWYELDMASEGQVDLGPVDMLPCRKPEGPNSKKATYRHKVIIMVPQMATPLNLQGNLFQAIELHSWTYEQYHTQIKNIQESNLGAFNWDECLSRAQVNDNFIALCALLDSGAPYTVNLNGDTTTVLHTAVLLQQFELIDYLAPRLPLEALYAYDHNRMNPLHLARSSGDHAMAERLNLLHAQITANTGLQGRPIVYRQMLNSNERHNGTNEQAQRPNRRRRRGIRQ